MGTIHKARVDHSDRLNRVHRFLKARGPFGATSWELMQEAKVVAPGTAVSELRAQGISIDCALEILNGKRVWRYKLSVYSPNSLDLFPASR